MPQDEELPQPSSKAPRRRKIMWDRVLNFSVGFLAVIILSVVGPFGHTHSYELARPAACGCNLSSIGRAIAAYQGEYDNRMPPDLDALFRMDWTASFGMEQDERLFVCPSSETAPCEGGPAAACLDGHCDYIYMGPVLDDAPEDLTIAFGLPINHQQEVVNLLRCDFGVARRKPLAVTEEAQRTNRYLGGVRRAGE
jgi:hypothetical protein